MYLRKNLMKSAYSELNKLKMSWKNRYEVNSTIKSLKIKIKKENDKNKIKYYDYLLYLINLNYYEIVSKL